MFLARASVRRPVMATMVILAFVVLGLFSYGRLFIDLFPEIEFPVVTVSIVYPGAGPEEVETQVTDRVEEALSTLSLVKRIDSSSIENVSNIFIEFELEADVDVVAMDVKDKVESILSELPDEIEPPLISKFDINAIPIIDLAVSGRLPIDRMYELSDDVIKPFLSRVEGVASVTILGGYEREIQIALDRSRMQAYGITLDDVIQSVSWENISLPTGRITQKKQEYTIRVDGEFPSVESLNELRIGLKDGGNIPLSFVGKAIDGFKDIRELARFNGHNSVALTIQKRADANTVATARGVKEQLGRLEKMLPEGVVIDIARDRSLFIRDSIMDVLTNLFIGVLLTALLLYVFIHDWRGTFIAAVAMPTSIISTFLLIDAAGFTFNMMTLMALGLSVGILVTNAIVVLENIFRMRELGKGAMESAEEGTSEIATAVIASTLTNVVVFTPIAFMSGIVGRFFFQFGLTVVFATLFSLFVSFTLTPMLASRMLREGERRDLGRLGGYLRRFAVWWDGFYQHLEEGYSGSLGYVLSHRKTTIGMGTLAFFFALMLFGFIGGEFIPEGDQGLVRVGVELPPGVSITEMERTLKAIEERLLDLPEVESVLATAGGEMKSVEEGELIIQMVDLDERDIDVWDFQKKIRPLLADIPAADITVNTYTWAGEEDVVIEVTGQDLEEVKAVAKKVHRAVLEVPGLVEVRTSIKEGKPEFTFVPHRQLLADYGITTFDVAGVLRAAYEGVVSSTYREGDKEYDVRVRLSENDRIRTTGLEELTVKSDGRYLPIKQLGRIEYGAGESEILRKNRQKLVNVTANIGSGTLSEVIDKIREKTSKLDLPEGVQIHFGGQAEEQAESFASILTALILAIILTYMVLGSILESFVHPVTIMITLPLGLVGANLALLLTRQTINIFSLMALVMMVGVVVNNAILLLDYTAVLRKEGKNIFEALMTACPIRLRPILMANAAIVIGMLPQAVSTGPSSSFRISMAIVMIGGIVVSAVFTLYLVPALYVVLDRFTRLPGKNAKGESRGG
ncbi:MAG: efflux RND transporter permease subunit [Candidatus Glassbacteria bacterium]